MNQNHLFCFAFSSFCAFLVKYSSVVCPTTLPDRRLWPEYFFNAKSISGPAGSPSLYADINRKQCLDAFFMNDKGTFLIASGRDC